MSDIWPFDRLEVALSKFDEEDYILPQSDDVALIACIKLFTDDGKYGTYSKAQQKRLSHARKILSDVLRIGPELFILCCINISITALSRISYDALNDLDRWWNGTVAPEGLTKLTRRLCEAHSITSLVSQPLRHYSLHIPIEDSRCISDVLTACGINSEHLRDWNLELLDQLPNLRHYKPCPSTVHTPWYLHPIEPLGLPTLEELLCELFHVVRKGNQPREAEVFEGIQKQDWFEARDWARLITRILSGEENKLRILNLPTAGLIDETVEKTCQKWAEASIRRHHNLASSILLNTTPPNANITPRLTRTEVHHDSLPQISTAIGKQGPLKLWILWPSTELDHLPSCRNNTANALSTMRDGSFLVQMAGESVVVPPNSPHAVVALQTSYLYGYQFSPEVVYDPSSIHIDIVGSIPTDLACRSNLRSLCAGLDDPLYRLSYLQRFLRSWAHTIHVINDNHLWRKELVEILTHDIEVNGCAWCEQSGFLYTGNDHCEHASWHLRDNFMAPEDDDGDWGGSQRKRRRTNHTRGAKKPRLRILQ